MLQLFSMKSNNASDTFLENEGEMYKLKINIASQE